jgi:hypothetical protein
LTQNRSQSREIEEIISLGQELGQLEKPPNCVRIKGDLGQRHQPKRHKILIRDTQHNPQEIILKTLPRKAQQRALKITTKKDGKSTSQP